MQKQIVLTTGEVLSTIARHVDVTSINVAASQGFYQLTKGEGEKRVLVAEVPFDCVSFVVHEPKLLDGGFVEAE
ncbi:hypothetical protein PHG31p127 [Aeromonas phage 31]|uniref:Uncharacterized protein PHG31ORF129c n=1 Tax=Aeromonas phage 31 TaxID=321023 RepID=Q56EN4_9CAUD|nr:hypothetical protein PHG31p127 [Aeromonas phage 31]AAX63616.1 hypothetical protein PHG31p127 [Aeromonas phage 31]APU01022.1 hypothetical protein [Aeromonas phage 31.2]